MIWSMEKIKSKTSDPVLTVLQGHDNLVDVVVFANFDACKVIDKADYNKDYAAIAQELQAEESPQSKPAEEPEEESKGAIKEENMTKLEKIAAMKEKMKIKRQAAKDASNKKQQDDAVPQQEVNQYVASGCRDKLIKLWNCKDGREIFTFVGHDNWVNDLVFHPSGKFLLSVSDDKTIRVWDLSHGRIHQKMTNIHDHFVTCIDMRQKHVVTGSVDKSVKIWGCRWCFNIFFWVC